MKLEILENNKSLSPDEIKYLYNEGVDIYDGYYYVIAEPSEFDVKGQEAVPISVALRSFTNLSNIQWTKVNFRGKNVIFGAVELFRVKPIETD